MTVPLESPLQPGEQVIITMEIDVTAPIEEGGKYGTFLLDDEILAFSHFFPILAVYDDEGWNTEIPAPHGDSVFSDSGFFLVRLETPTNLTVVTSGQLVTNEVLPDGDHEARFYSAGPVRDFYLAASRRFEVVQARVGETIINSYAPPEFVAQNREVLASVEASVAMFNELYGTYPYTELDFVSTATLALGVEYPGVVAMAMGHYDPESGFDQPTIVSTVVHEAAHQWFYGTVGNDQLDEPWLDEAMAQYATWVYWRETQGEGGDEGFRAHLDSRWARVEHADIPIGLPAEAYEGTEYGAIVYGRGPLFVDDLAMVVGQETFEEFLAEYATKFKYGIASTQDYQALVERHCGCDLSQEFEAAVYPR
jgi:aminopeptidase N